MQCMQLQGQKKGWFLGDACPMISVGIVSSHSTYLKNIKPSKRAQAAFWSYSWCILSSFSFPQRGKRDFPAFSAWAEKGSSLQNLLVTDTEYDTRSVPQQLLPYWSVLCRRHWKRGESCRQESALLSSGTLFQITASVSQDLLPKLLASWQVLFCNVH